MRFARSDMRGYIVSYKNDYGASHWLYGVLQCRSRLKINFCEILGAGRFSTFATKSAPLRHANAPCECPLIGVERKWLAMRQTGANDP